MDEASTRDRLLVAARTLFETGGENGVSMRRVALAVGVTPMAIYKHYADKDALLSALMLDGLASWEARVARITETEPMSWLRRWGDAFLDFALEEPRRYEAAFLLKASKARQYPGDFAAGRSPAMQQAYRRIAQLKRSDSEENPATDVGLAIAALGQGLVSMYRAGRFVSEADFRAAYRRAVNHCIASYTGGNGA
jgi:AcrR family transcriptional regulator